MMNFFSFNLCHEKKKIFLNLLIAINFNNYFKISEFASILHQFGISFA